MTVSDVGNISIIGSDPDSFYGNRHISAALHIMINTCNMHAKARHLGGFAFCKFHRLGVPKQVLGGTPLGFGSGVKDKASERSCKCFLPFR